MSLWQFSESSQPLLKRCVEAATIDNNNKWIQKFGSKHSHLDQTNKVVDINAIILAHDNISEDSNPKSPLQNMEVDENPVCARLEVNEDLCHKILDLNPVEHFDFIVEKCLENSSILLILAKQLPVTAIEKLCKYIYVTKNVNSTFMVYFYTMFLPAFLKREPTRLSLNLLLEAKCYPVLFKQMLVIITKDVELANNILYDLVSTLNSNEQTEFLLTLSQSDVSNDHYIYHLFSINIAYKNCQKSKELQRFVLTKLIELSQYSLTCKNYGRLLLCYLQAQRECPLHFMELENIINNHRSAFKTPCLNAFNGLKLYKENGTNN